MSVIYPAGNASYTLGNVSVSTNGAAGTSYTIPWTGAAGQSFWNSSSNPSIITVNSVGVNPGLKVSGDADIQGNLTVQGTNVTEILARIQDRLAILVPDPRLLAKYEALREAYEHYRTLEALCVDSDPKEG